MTLPCDRRPASRLRDPPRRCARANRVRSLSFPPGGGFADWCMVRGGGLWSRVVSPAAPASHHVTRKANRPFCTGAQEGRVAAVACTAPACSRPEPNYPLISRGWSVLLGVRGEITGWVHARRTRMSLGRDRESRATETRVRPVPAVAMRGRCVSVADDTAERPVQARTRSGAVRKMRGRPLPGSARGRITSSTMTSHLKNDELETTNRATDTRANHRIHRRPATTGIAAAARASGRDSLHER
jgi:hypothetical protein